MMYDAASPALAVMFAIGVASSCLALAAAVRRRHGAMAGWAGLALAASFQTAVCFPLIVALLIGRRVPARLWLAPPLSFLAATAAARITGWPAADPAAIYIGQAGWSPALSDNAPNLWAIAQALPFISEFPLAGLALAATAGAASWLVARFAWRTPAGNDLVAAALLTALIIPGLLPGMGERAFLIPGILAMARAFMLGDRQSWTICALVEAGLALSLLGDWVGIPTGAIVGAVPMIVATTLIARQFLVSPANDNGLPLNPFRAYPAGRVTW
jgi:hypothetical protein